MFLIEIIISGFESGVLEPFQFKLGLINSGSGSDLSPILAPAPTNNAGASRSGSETLITSDSYSLIDSYKLLQLIGLGL